MSHPFHFPIQLYCKELTDLFQQAISQPNPAQWLYKKNVRSQLFMAESLTRALAESGESRRAIKACALFKKLEDLLGEIDDYDHLAKEYSKYPGVKKDEIDYYEKKHNKHLDKLNKKLIKHEFYQEEFNAIEKHLAVDFSNEKLIKKLEEQIRFEINKCYRFYSIFSNGFTDMEGQVHEVRRKLRWISIYGQSFNGLIVLDKKKTHHQWSKKYLAKKDADDPYNNLIISNDFKTHIHFDQHAFYALNKVISQLGDIKNKGLQIEYLAKAIRKTFGVSEKDAITMASQQLKSKNTVEELLKEAHILLKDFFEKSAIHTALI